MRNCEKIKYVPLRNRVEENSCKLIAMIRTASIGKHIIEQHVRYGLEPDTFSSGEAIFRLMKPCKKKIRVGLHRISAENLSGLFAVFIDDGRRHCDDSISVRDHRPIYLHEHTHGHRDRCLGPHKSHTIFA